MSIEEAEKQLDKKLEELYQLLEKLRQTRKSGFIYTRYIAKNEPHVTPMTREWTNA